MTDYSVEDFPEFEAIQDMSEMDAVAYLLALARRYTAMAEVARKEATRRLYDTPDGEVCESEDGTRFRMTSKTTRKVDVSALKELYPEVYTSLCEKGEVTISPKALESADVEGAIVTSVSRYAELCR